MQSAFPAAFLLQLTRGLLAQSPQASAFWGLQTVRPASRGPPARAPPLAIGTTLAVPETPLPYAAAAAANVAEALQEGPLHQSAAATAAAAAAASAAQSPLGGPRDLPSVSHSVPDEREITRATGQQQQAAAAGPPSNPWKRSSSGSSDIGTAAAIQHQRKEAKAASTAAIAAAIEAAAVAGVACAAAVSQQRQDQQQQQRQEHQQQQKFVHSASVSPRQRNGPPRSSPIIKPSPSLSPLTPGVLAALSTTSEGSPREPLVRPSSPLDSLGPLGGCWALRFSS